MSQLSFEFAVESPTIAERDVTKRHEDDLDRAYARASDWSRALAERLGQKIRLVVTDNRSTMLAARPKAGRLEVRLHHMFLTADENILDAVGDYLSDSDAGAAGMIDRFVEENRARFVAPGPSQAALRSEGRHHDLRAIADDLARLFSCVARRNLFAPSGLSLKETAGVLVSKSSDCRAFFRSRPVMIGTFCTMYQTSPVAPVSTLPGRTSMPGGACSRP